MGLIKKKEIMITTIDNPYDPFTQSADWYHFDTEEKYFTYNYVDRVVQEAYSEDKEHTEEEKYDLAMRDIVKLMPETYKLVEHTIEVDEVDELVGF